jgi:hypothetical protein
MPISVRRSVYAIYAASRLVPAKTRVFVEQLETFFERVGTAT